METINRGEMFFIHAVPCAVAKVMGDHIRHKLALAGKSMYAYCTGALDRTGNGPVCGEILNTVED